MGAALNAGILILSQIAGYRHVTADSWRWLFQLAAAPALLGMLILIGLPLYFPELFPTDVRSIGTGIAFNTGRFVTAAGIFAAGALFTALDGSYSQVGAICGLVYAAGIVVIYWAPDTDRI
ncbi:MAG: hypothetical protein SGI77_21630 [Pirellulaceae bacterium]|nr:hypothetical protein [Pirellulaceae bacterium]